MAFATPIFSKHYCVADCQLFIFSYSLLILNIMEQWIENTFGLSINEMDTWIRLCIILAIVLFAYLVDLLFSKAVVPIIRKLTLKTKAEWDDIFFDDAVCSSFSRILPAIILTAALPFAIDGIWGVLISRLTLIYIIITTCRFLSAIIHAIFNLFVHRKEEKAQSLMGIRQTFVIIVWIIGAILATAVIIDRNPVYLLTGLGAAATILMLVFQDSIKGLVAGIQLSFQDMVRVGDWIEMPSRNANGVVTEITLNTIKVQNWDNTIATVPPYSLMQESFLNWRGMQDSAGRRLNRSLNVDVNTVRFLSNKEVNDYISNQQLPAEAAKRGNTVTNLEAFRYTMEQHLRHSKDINPEMTFMVRTLEIGSEGIPVELYAFSRTKDWVPYEHIQAQLIEFALASLAQFGLRAYQRGSDYRQ